MEMEKKGARVGSSVPLYRRAPLRRPRPPLG